MSVKNRLVAFLLIRLIRQLCLLLFAPNTVDLGWQTNAITISCGMYGSRRGLGLLDDTSSCPNTFICLRLRANKISILTNGANIGSANSALTAITFSIVFSRANGTHASAATKPMSKNGTTPSTIPSATGLFRTTKIGLTKAKSLSCSGDEGNIYGRASVPAS